MPINELKLAKDLIRCPSVTPKDAGAINLLAKKLRSLGFKCQMMNFKNIKNLYAKLGKSSPNFCFAGHTDVVPVGDLRSWSVNPFLGVVKNNKLIGRGASDMKGSIACFIAALSQFKKVRPKFKGSISLLITGDEEAIPPWRVARAFFLHRPTAKASASNMSTRARVRSFRAW